MAGRPKKPIELHMANGNKRHLTKAEIEQRKAEEIHAPDDNIQPPDYLSAKQKARVSELAGELSRVGIMSNLDCESLAWYITAHDNYIKFTRLVNKCKSDDLKTLESAVSLQDKAFKQCRAAAGDLGLTITARCRLVVPKGEDKPKHNKFDVFASGGSG